jgi:hypothetical protein
MRLFFNKFQKPGDHCPLKLKVSPASCIHPLLRWSYNAVTGQAGKEDLLLFEE